MCSKISIKSSRQQECQPTNNYIKNLASLEGELLFDHLLILFLNGFTEAVAIVSNWEGD